MASTGKKISACLTQIYGENTNRRFKLNGSKVSIGRSFNAQIRLKNPNVSRNHCTLMYIDNGWEITDDKSQNGTYISGRKLKPGEVRLLQCGDIIFLGPPSEMPEAFCYDDAFIDDSDDNVESEQESDLVSELPLVKCPAEREIMTISKRKNSLNENSDAVMNLVSNKDSFPSESSGCRNKVSVPSESSKLSSFPNSRRKKVRKDVNIHNDIAHEKVASVNSSSLVSSKLNEPDNGYQINEISSTGDDKAEDSQSLLDIENGAATDPFSCPDAAEFKAKSSCCDPQTSKNSKETQILKSKLALLSEQIKNLERSKSDLLKNYEEVCKKNKTLDEQLVEQKKLKEDLRICELKAKDEVKNELLEKFEEDLICNICTELLIKPTVLDCSHTFCQYCIKEWKKKKNECPMCRHRIQTMTPVLTLEHFIDKTLSTLTPEQREKRNQIIKERDNVQKKPATPTSRRSRHGRRRNRRSLTNMRAQRMPSTPREGDVEIIAERRNVVLPLPIPNVSIPLYISNMNFRIPDALLSDSQDSISFYVA